MRASLIVVEADPLKAEAIVKAKIHPGETTEGPGPLPIGWVESQGLTPGECYYWTGVPR